MFNQLLTIGNFVIDAFLNIWPYLLITIPLAVAVQMSGASKYINRAFQASPVAAIFLATAVGAFSPFCSCTVIPVTTDRGWQPSAARVSTSACSPAPPVGSVAAKVRTIGGMG